MHRLIFASVIAAVALSVFVVADLRPADSAMAVASDQANPNDPLKTSPMTCGWVTVTYGPIWVCE